MMALTHCCILLLLVVEEGLLLFEVALAGGEQAFSGGGQVPTVERFVASRTHQHLHSVDSSPVLAWPVLGFIDAYQRWGTGLPSVVGAVGSSAPLLALLERC
jgi:hypothetical protein